MNAKNNLKKLLIITAAGYLCGCSANRAKELTTISETQAFETRPKLQASGRRLSDFVPSGWELMDSAELDFNEDGIADFVGVLEFSGEDTPYDGQGLLIPRILFALASVKEGQYRLDFQDINLIRTRNEGGVFGDPYEPLTVQGRSFTTHSFGGSAWKWSEAYTYTYQKGTWYLTASENISYYNGYIIDMAVDDYESLTGIRKIRSSELEDMENQDDKEVFDLTYQVALDEPLTIFQAGMRRQLSWEREDGFPVETIWIAPGILLDKDLVKRPGADSYYGYRDENCLLYTFSVKDSPMDYLAFYEKQNKTLSVIAQDAEMGSPCWHKDKIYYTSDLKIPVTRKDKEGNPVQQEEYAGMRLYRVNSDGTEKQTVFEYLPDQEGQEGLFYASLNYHISGDEIIASIYTGDCPQPYYRMKTDGSQVELLGTVPKTSDK